MMGEGQALLAGLRELIERQKQVSFIDPATAEDEDALGILIARHVGWDGAAIMRISAWALEDANFHTEAATLIEMAEATA